MKHKTLRSLSTLLSSTLFFVVSCTGATSVAGSVLADLDARDIAGGDEPHRFFYVLVVTADKTTPVLLRELDEFIEENEASSLLLPPGKIESAGYAAGNDTGQDHFAYMAAGEEVQKIELQVTDFDHSRVTSHYTVSNNEVTPTYSKQVHYFKLVYQALPYALGFALILNLFGKSLRWYLNKQVKSTTE